MTEEIKQEEIVTVSIDAEGNVEIIKPL